MVGWRDEKLLRQSLGRKLQGVWGKLVKSLQDMGANMSFKVHFLHRHLDKFPDNCGYVSNEQGERFHQDIKTMEEYYQGRWHKWMMADYCWRIKRDLNNIEHDRQKRVIFFTIVPMITKVLFLLLVY